MKLSYKALVPEPYILELSDDEIGIIRFYMGKALESAQQEARYANSQKLATRDYLNKTMKELDSVISELEKSIQELKYGV